MLFIENFWHSKANLRTYFLTLPQKVFIKT